MVTLSNSLFLHRLKMLTYCNVRVDNIFQLHYLLFFQTHLVSLFTIRIFNLPGQDWMFSVAPNLHCRVLVYCTALHCIVVRILLLHVLFEKERKNLIWPRTALSLVHATHSLTQRCPSGTRIQSLRKSLAHWYISLDFTLLLKFNDVFQKERKNWTDHCPKTASGLEQCSFWLSAVRDINTCIA